MKETHKSIKLSSSIVNIGWLTRSIVNGLIASVLLIIDILILISICVIMLIILTSYIWNHLMEYLLYCLWCLFGSGVSQLTESSVETKEDKHAAEGLT